MRKRLKEEAINNQLIGAVKERMPETENLASFITQILDIGKEAVYRRLRREVPFTISEAFLLSKRLGFSLDHLLTTDDPPQSILVNVNCINYCDPVETYYRMVQSSLEDFLAVNKDPALEWYTASNIVPQPFYMDHAYLSKFLLYKWMYQNEKIDYIKYFSELEIPEKVKLIQKEYEKATKAVAYTYFILDQMMFLSLINDIKYFYDINLITQEEKEHLKAEFVAMIDSLEELATKGRHENGKEIFIYISNINFEASYSYLNASNFKICFIRVFSINYLSTTDVNMYESQKEWVQSLKKYATLITVSGEMQRIQFFDKQRAYINKLL
jgi:hypothetical protein